MAKIKIYFDNENYQIDESSFSDASSKLQSHLSNVMNGSGATIKFGGTSYNVDSTKLQNATNDFTSHLGTIAGNGRKVIVNGIEYSIDSGKVQGAVAELKAIFGNLNSDDSGINEYGFYFDEEYLSPKAPNDRYRYGTIFHEDGSSDSVYYIINLPASKFYTNKIEVNSMIFTVSNNGKTLTNNSGEEYSLIKTPSSTLNEFGFYFGEEYWGQDSDGNPYAYMYYDDGQQIDKRIYENELPAGSFVYETNKITHLGSGSTMEVLENGKIIGNMMYLKSSDAFYEECYAYEGYTKRMKIESKGNMVIPEKFNYYGQNYITTGIKYFGFSEDEELTSVTLPNSIKLIAEGAFSNCVNLQKVIYEGKAYTTFNELLIALENNNVVVKDRCFDNTPLK